MEYNNYKNIESGNNKYGQQRLKLAVFLRDNILNKLNINWCIENGTLLGAFRNNKFIDHDDDFDIGLFIKNEIDIEKIYKKIKIMLENTIYDARLISSYSSKIEVFDKSYGNYILQGPKYNKNNYHHVTVDLQFYLLKNNYYNCLYNISVFKINIDIKYIFPFSKIILENEEFKCPANCKKYLETLYGSIDKNAKFNSKTGYYELM